MWIPRDAAEIEAAARRGDLEETPIFDAKADLPVPKKNSSVAVDVAAMSTDGGALLYGVAEDEHKRPTIPEPIELTGAADRIAQIVETSIAEVPFIDQRTYPCEDDPSKGYLLVLVPQSARAPHQVIVGGDRRFYGRGDKGNRILSEGEIARLYERRQRWEQDRDALLVQTANNAPYGPHVGLGFLHAFARPVVPDAAIWDRAVVSLGSRDALLAALRGGAPKLQHWRRLGADAWMLSTATTNPEPDSKMIRYLTNRTMNVDGCTELFDGGVVQEVNAQYGPVEPNSDFTGVRIVYESDIAEQFAGFLAMLATLYREGQYFGHVDIGVLVTGLEGARSLVGLDPQWRFVMIEDRTPYAAANYPRTERVAASELAEPHAIVRRMLGRLFEATTGRDEYDPFSEQR